MATATPETLSATFLLDPACPWCWRTAQWMRAAREELPLQITWELFSLEYVNRNSDNPDYLERMKRNRLAIRLLELARRTGGNEAIDRLYTALGTARHERDQDLGDTAVLERALREAELDNNLLAQAQQQTDIDAELEQHYADYERKGVFGVPTLIPEGAAGPFFGPVISEVPQGADAVAMWRELVGIARRPYFLELKRARG